MNKQRQIVIVLLSAVVILTATIWYTARFYPRQLMPVGVEVEIRTQESEKYHNDCLHPCVRKLSDSTFVMVQTPFYGWNDCTIENPLLYESKDLRHWCFNRLLADTPPFGYHSDPNIFVQDTDVYFLMRECLTPQCNELNTDKLIVGWNINKNDTSNYVINTLKDGELTLCPILMRHNDLYYLYTVWYQFAPSRKCNGIAIWESRSLTPPDFHLIDTLPFDMPLVCDKYRQHRLFHHIFFIPSAKRYDLWHFDLFEYDGKLYMVSSAERDDNIMLSVSTDWKHFRTLKKPLINSHYSENHTNYRQYYYKPTAIVHNDSLFLFYTANKREDPKRNQLFLSVIAMDDLDL